MNFTPVTGVWYPCLHTTINITKKKLCIYLGQRNPLMAVFEAFRLFSKMVVGLNIAYFISEAGFQI